MGKNDKIINIDLTENEMFNKYLDDMRKSNKRDKRLAIVAAIVIPLLFTLLLFLK